MMMLVLYFATCSASSKSGISGISISDGVSQNTEIACAFISSKIKILHSSYHFCAVHVPGYIVVTETNHIC